MAKQANDAVPERNNLVLVITRTFDAPRELVWELWSAPQHFKHWMGPRDHPVVYTEGEFRRGGKWRGCLQSIATGEELWQSGEYLEIKEPERLVFTFAWDRADGSRSPETEITVLFAEQQGKTVMTFCQAMFETEEARDGHNLGWNSTFDRLAEYLQTLA
jgi:uncharacterized protein YndB with AHSA1/START domain